MYVSIRNRIAQICKSQPAKAPVGSWLKLGKKKHKSKAGSNGHGQYGGHIIVFTLVAHIVKHMELHMHSQVLFQGPVYNCKQYMCEHWVIIVVKRLANYIPSLIMLRLYNLTTFWKTLPQHYKYLVWNWNLEVMRHYCLGKFHVSMVKAHMCT